MVVMLLEECACSLVYEKLDIPKPQNVAGYYDLNGKLWFFKIEAEKSWFYADYSQVEGLR
jgi:hypothetical protein